jgi:hypothetical protein
MTTRGDAKIAKIAGYDVFVVDALHDWKTGAAAPVPPDKKPQITGITGMRMPVGGWNSRCSRGYSRKAQRER